MQPLVSVVISTHNRLSYLKEAVYSVLSQTFADFELIICDDASKDGTPNYIADLQKKDARIKSVRHDQNIGMTRNWNSGIENSRGTYVAKLDDDNHYLPGFLAKAVAALESTKEAVLVFCDEWMIDENGTRREQESDNISRYYKRDTLSPGTQELPYLAVNQSIGINATLFRRAAIAEKMFRVETDSSADIDLFLRLSQTGSKAYYLAERLIEYRIHQNAHTANSVKNIKAALGNVETWSSVTLQGEYEAARRERLCEAYGGLARAFLMSRQKKQAQSVLQEARKSGIWDKRLQLFGVLSALPEPVAYSIVSRRYAK